MSERKKLRFGLGVIAAATVATGANLAVAGGLLDLEFGDASFSDPLHIDNPYWPLNPDNLSRTFTYVSETADECVLDQVSVNDNYYGPTYLLTGAPPYGGLTALQVVDIEWVFEDVEVCGPGLLPADGAIKEFTLDWYLQDDQRNIWYVGELSQNFEEPGCGTFPNPGVNPVDDPQCFAGSWEAGKVGGSGDEAVVGVAGIVVPGDMPSPGEPLENGTYFMQEVAFEAEDMAKILRQHAALTVEDGFGPGDYGDCRKTKEWTALEPGASVEHKWYCADGPGLVLVEGVGGGPTERELLVDVSPLLP